MIRDQEPRSPGVFGMFAQSLQEQRENEPKVKGKGLHKVHKDTPAIAPASVVKPVQRKEPNVVVAETESVEDDNAVHFINPESVTPWELADRPDDEFGDLTDLTESIRSYGQEVPALVRPIAGVEDRYELIYGRRRWTCCLDLGKPLKAFIRSMDDQEAFKRMHIENEQRKDLSSWAKAVSWKKAIDKGVYKNESALAAHLGIHRATLSNIMAFNRIAPEIIKAIGSDIKSVGILSAKALAQLTEPEEIEAAVALSPKIAAGQLGAENISKAVLAATSAVVAPGDHRSRVITDERGSKLFSLRVTGRGATEISFTVEATKRFTQDELVDKVKALFK